LAIIIESREKREKVCCCLFVSLSLSLQICSLKEGHLDEDRKSFVRNVPRSMPMAPSYCSSAIFLMSLKKKKKKKKGPSNLCEGRE
jgi:hypothetical protein